MRYRTLLAALVCLGLPLLAAGQSPQLNLPSFTSLQHKATRTVDFTIGSLVLGLVGILIDEHDKDSAEVKRIIGGLKTVQVRSYRFDSDFVYPSADVDAVRAQLSAPGWSQLTQVRNRKTNKDVDVYIALENHKVMGLAVIESEPRAFTIVNIVGAIDLDEVAKVRTALGLPTFGAEAISQNTR